MAAGLHAPEIRAASRTLDLSLKGVLADPKT